MSLFDRRPVGWLVGASMIGAALMVPVSTASAEPDPPVSADSSRERREVISERTESSQTFQNPDGSLTTELSTQLLRFKDDDGTWTDIDTSLVRRGGVWEPKAAPVGLEFSAGGAAPFVEFERDGGDSVALGWPTALPAPVVEGSTLTYPDVVPNGDLTVTALPDGFSHSLVLREAPANPDMSIPLPVRLDGTKLVETSNGGLQVNSADDSPVRAPAPLMWDSSSMPENDRPGTIRPVDATVTGTGATAKLVLTPDAEMLSDPETNYPVTIDPTFTQDTPVSDTYIASAGTPDSCGASAGANCFSQSATPSSATRAGDSFETGADGSVVARSFLRFPNFDFTNKQVTGASLTARNVQSRACVNGATIPEAIAANWSETSLTWSNQPTVVANSSPPQYYVPHGGPTGSSCTAHGWGTWGVTAQVQAMANGTRPNYGFRLRAATETANASWRRWRAKEGTTGTTYYPKLSITYNTKPSVLSTQVGPCTDCTGDPLVVDSEAPQVTVTVEDDDSATQSLRVDVELWAGHEDVPTVRVDTKSISVTGSNPAVWQLPAQPESDYSVRARAWDGQSYGNWSTWRRIELIQQSTSAEAEDVADLAAAEGISNAEATEAYGWHNEFAGVADQLREAYPTTFAGAEVNPDNVAEQAVVSFTEIPPQSAADIVEESPVPVTVETDASYSEQDLGVALQAVHSAVQDQAAGDSVSTVYDDAANVFRATIYREGVSTARSAPSSSSAAAEKSVSNVDDSNGESPSIVITYAEPENVGEDTIRGGAILTLSSTGGLACTSGWPVKKTNVNQKGLITAGHCNNTLYYTQRDVLGAAQVIPLNRGDLQYHSSTETVGKSFYVKKGKYRAIKGLRTPAKGQKLCKYGRTSGKTCDKVRNLNSCRDNYCNLVEMYSREAAGGDSGGPWFRGGYAYGVHSGWHWAGLEKRDQFTPLYKTLGDLQLKLNY